jgi:hypothetical protein
MGRIAKFSPSPSHGLWSLWELMLKKAALEFGRACADLRMAEMTCHHMLSTGREVPPAIILKMGQTAADILGNLKRVAILSDLNQELGPELDRFQTALRGPNLADIKSRAEHLRNHIYDELENEHYFQVDRFEVRFYDQKEAFGPKVASKFKAAVPDIENAGNCIALQQPDACVFHLMRAMEVAVRKLGRRVNVTITPQTTWRQITGAMDAKIRAMPETTDKQKHKKNDWEAARANLHQVGSVWRNTTMHPATSYTRGQARDVFEAVRVFMSGLCEL